MKEDQLEKIIRKIRIPTDDSMRSQTMSDIERVHRSRHDRRSGLYLVRMKITPMGAATWAALFLVLLGLMAFSYLKRNQPDVSVEERASCVDMLTSRSLRMACRRGQLEELDKVFERVNKLTGPRPVTLSTRELIDEIDG